MINQACGEKLSAKQFRELEERIAAAEAARRAADQIPELSNLRNRSPRSLLVVTEVSQITVRELNAEDGVSHQVIRRIANALQNRANELDPTQQATLPQMPLFHPNLQLHGFQYGIPTQARPESQFQSSQFTPTAIPAGPFAHFSGPLVPPLQQFPEQPAAPPAQAASQAQRQSQWPWYQLPGHPGTVC